ncbi:Zinc/iron permease [Irpex rosettiformis]|uniref:Zinc/iron permease n=1 Tax=Irpex rosettiformis TaxID=378272 RepID=A0ACB8TY90_9APHY|nr:Zinc/iron permease [Irpex rosettiformis]
MSGFFSLLVMSTLLGGGSFLVGILPLSFTFSKTAIAHLSSVGAGLLLGTALGVIIPEGIETIIEKSSTRVFPTTTVALSLITGFTFMLLVEPVIHRVSGHIHQTSHQAPVISSASANTDGPSPSRNVVFDVELGELEQAEGITTTTSPTRSINRDITQTVAQAPATAYPLTLGLAVHALADGFALGSSAFAPADTSLSLVVFLALIVHKAPAVLALSTSLLSTNLPREECRKHIAVFSASTPIGALGSYVLLSFLNVGSEGNWAGILILISGGTFLYVATVLQPGKAASEEVNEKLRLGLVVTGIILPLLIGVVVGHE